MSYTKDKSKKAHYSKLSDSEEGEGDSYHEGSSSSSSSAGASYSNMLRREDEGKGYPVKINVYDLHPFNKYVYWMGLGAFHAGIEVLLREWTFGYGPSNVTGMSINEPRRAPGAVYRETIFLGMCTKTRKEIEAIIGRLAGEFPGNSYHMLTHNCVTFCDTLCFELLGTHIPAWINRLPNFAYHIKCCLPKDLRGPFPGVEETPSASKKREESRPILGAPIADVIKCQDNYAATQLQEQHEKQKQEEEEKKKQNISDDSEYVPPSVVTMSDEKDEKDKKDESDEKDKKRMEGEVGSTSGEGDKDTTPSAIILID